MSDDVRVAGRSGEIREVSNTPSVSDKSKSTRVVWEKVPTTTMTKLVRHAITEAAEDHEPNDQDKQRITFLAHLVQKLELLLQGPFSVGDALGVFDIFLLILVSRYITPSRRFYGMV